MEFWTENIDAIWTLSNSYRNGGLTLFLGAGLSQGCGLPLWPKLVEELHTETCRRGYNTGGGVYGTFDNPKGWGGLAIANHGFQAQALSKLSLPIQSRFCKSKLGKDYNKVLQQTLYNGPYNVSSAIEAILKLENLKSICTYNYDDLIETNSTNNHFYSVCSDGIYFRKGVAVYHVHGILPSDLTQDPEGDIVFSEDEYHALYINYGHWANLIQLRLLIESESVLFIGLSFEDPNLRRLIDMVKSIKDSLNFYNICKLPFRRPLEKVNYVSYEEVEISVLNEVYNNLGVKNIWIDDYDPDISIVVKSLSANDPVDTFTTDFRSHLLKEAIKLGVSSKSCFFVGCPENAINGHKWCINHAMGDRQRFMEYAPTPKTINDKCSEPNCNRITAGLSKKCIKH